MYILIYQRLVRACFFKIQFPFFYIASIVWIIEFCLTSSLFPKVNSLKTSQSSGFCRNFTKPHVEYVIYVILDFSQSQISRQFPLEKARLTIKSSNRIHDKKHHRTTVKVSKSISTFVSKFSKIKQYYQVKEVHFCNTTKFIAIRTLEFHYERYTFVFFSISKLLLLQI